MPMKQHYFTTQVLITITQCPLGKYHTNEAKVAICEWLQMREPDFYNRIFKLVPSWETFIKVFGDNTENSDTCLSQINELHLTLSNDFSFMIKVAVLTENPSYNAGMESDHTWVKNGPSRWYLTNMCILHDIFNQSYDSYL